MYSKMRGRNNLIAVVFGVLISQVGSSLVFGATANTNGKCIWNGSGCQATGGKYCIVPNKPEAPLGTCVEKKSITAGGGLCECKPNDPSLGGAPGAPSQRVDPRGTPIPTNPSTK